MLCPKGNPDEKVWEKVSGAVDDVDEILENSGPLSDILEKDRKRIINLTEEIMSWRCYLRESQYLINAKFFSIPLSINGKFLTDDMVNFTLKAKQLRKNFWSSAASGIPLENIKTPNLKVLHNYELNVTPYEPYNLED